MNRVTMRHLRRKALLWLAPLWLVGCGRTGDLTTVEGIVTLDGKPAAGATVILIPEGNTGRSAWGTARQDGSFRLATSDRDGASPGQYKVIVGVVALVRPGGDPGKEEMMARQEGKRPMSSGELFIPPVYGDAAITPLHCSVPICGKLVLGLHTTGR